LVDGNAPSLAREIRRLLRLSWSPEAFRWLLERHGKLNVLEMTESSDYRFILAICGK
jgi:hypothetical protein